MRMIAIVMTMMFFLAGPCWADTFQEGAKDVGQGFKKMGQETGEAFKKGGKEVGQGFKKMGQSTGQQAKKTGSTVGEWFRSVGKKTGEAFRQMVRDFKRLFTRD